MIAIQPNTQGPCATGLGHLLASCSGTTCAGAIPVGSGEPGAYLTLAEVRHGVTETSVAQGWPVIDLALPRLDGPFDAERWLAPGPVHYVVDGDIRLARGREFLFGHIVRDEAGTLQETVLTAYRSLFGSAEALGYPHLLRIWNFFPAINTAERGLERYRQFCVGRHQAFAERQPDFQSLLPAATAVGTEHGPVHVYFLAATSPGEHFENPRQVSAYRYPSLYGPRSPAFARATWHRSGASAVLFIAGTSSIVGHLTQHAQDPYKQAQETLANIDAVIAQRPGLVAAQCAFRVYVRYPEHLGTIKQAFRDRLGFMPQFRYVQGSICRADLLLEVEGIISQRS